MTKTWITPIFDRTYGNVQDVQRNPDQVNPKGCWNATDLNRIENNVAYCAEWMVEQHIVRTVPEIVVREDNYWTEDMIATKAEIDRIINNVRLLITLSSTNPAIARDLPTIYASTQVNYVLANQVEFALYLMHDQPKLPLDYWNVVLTHGIITQIIRSNGTIERLNTTTALVAEDETVTIRGVEYGESAQYQTFSYWSGEAEDIGLLNDYQSQETTFVMPYRNVEFTANFETHISRTLTITNGYISVNKDPTAESGPSTISCLAGDEIMIIANVAPTGKAFYEWTGTQEALNNITGSTYTEDPSTAILVMPDCNVVLEPHYINAGQHLVTVNNGSGGGWYNYNDTVSIYANVPNHYAFSHWSGNTNYLDNIYSSFQSFPMGDINLSFTANFTYQYSYNSVQVINGLIRVNNSDVDHADGLRESDSYTLVPTPPTSTEGLYSWTIEGEGSIGRDALGNYSNTFRVGDGNAIITAHYAPLRTLTVINENNSGNTTTYTITQGRKQRLTTAYERGNYRFNGWYENNEQLSTDTTITIEMNTTDRTIEARYDYYENYTVTVNNMNNDGRTTVSQVIAGHSWTASTLDESGDYMFNRWIRDGVEVSTSTRYRFTVTSNTTITVEYRPKEIYHLTVVNGSGSGDYKEREPIQITADPGDFSDWVSSNIYSIADSRNSTTTVKLGRMDGTVTARYNMRRITVTLYTHSYSTMLAQDLGMTINSGTVPSTYEFNHWEVVLGDATLANPYSSTTTLYAHLQDSEVRAVYTPIPRFTVTMVDGYVWDGNDWVTVASLPRDSANAIKMKPAPTGQQFLQWLVYVDGVLQTNAEDVYEPLAEQTRLRKLLRDITIKATYFIPDPTITYILTIERKDGSTEQQEYSVGTDVTIRASYPDTGYVFYKWTGDTLYLAGGVYSDVTYVHMPAQNVYIKENFVPEGYIPQFDLEMKSLNGQCCYTTEYEDPETHEIITTDHWVSRWSYPEGTNVRIRAVNIDTEYYFDEWDAINHDTSADARSIIESLSSTETTLTMPNYDVDVTPKIAAKTTYELRVNEGKTSGWYYEGYRADIYFDKENTTDVQYQFIRWVGNNIAEIELWDGGMFNVLTPGDENAPQYIKMPGKRIEVTATYKTLYRFTLTNGTIDSTGEHEGFFETGNTVAITADLPQSGMTFQYWTGDTAFVENIYDSTTNVTTTSGVTNLTAVYSTDSERNGIGYVTVDLKSTNTVNNDTITIVSGEIQIGFIITDINGHIYIVTSVNELDNTSAIYRMTKIVRGGNLYD